MKRLLRRWVVATAVPPWRSIHLALYRWWIWLSATAFRRCPSVVAVYLTRGGARSEIVPGISDLDFIVVTADEASLPAVRATGRLLHRLSAGLIDTYPNFVVSRKTLAHRWHTAPAWQYRFEEGRREWRLLAGEEIFSTLRPELSAAAWRRGWWLEVSRWWIVFARRLAADADDRDVVLRNVTCYKAVTELILLREALARGPAPRRARSAALSDLEAPLARRLRDTAARRYLDDDPGLVEETWSFLAGFFTEIWRSFEAAPFLAVRDEVEQTAVAGDESQPIATEVLAHARALQESIDRRWGDRCLRVDLLKSVCWDAEDWLLVVGASPERPPSAVQLAELVREQRELVSRHAPKLHLLLRLGSVALPLTPAIPRELHRGVATPATTPDLFLALGEAGVSWTDFTDWYLGEWRSNEQWVTASERQRRILEAVAVGAAAGRIAYPLTHAALPR